MGREVEGGFRIGNSCTPVVDSCQCMAKPIQYCKVKLKKKKSKQRDKKPREYGPKTWTIQKYETMAT